MPAFDKFGKGKHCMFAAGSLYCRLWHTKAHFNGQGGAAVMKIASWNVNGLAVCKRKGFLRVLANSRADIFCCQETRCPLSTPGYLQFWNLAKHPGIERFLFLGLTDVFLVSTGGEPRRRRWPPNPGVLADWRRSCRTMCLLR